MNWPCATSASAASRNGGLVGRGARVGVGPVPFQMVGEMYGASGGFCLSVRGKCYDQGPNRQPHGHQCGVRVVGSWEKCTDHPSYREL